MSLEQDDVTLSGQDRPGRWAFVSKWRLPMSNFRLFWRQISWYRMHFRSWNVQWVTSLNINFLLVMTSVFSFNAISKWTKPLHVFWNSKPSQYGFNFQHLSCKQDLTINTRHIHSIWSSLSPILVRLEELLLGSVTLLDWLIHQTRKDCLLGLCQLTGSFWSVLCAMFYNMLSASGTQNVYWEFEVVSLKIFPFESFSTSSVFPLVCHTVLYSHFLGNKTASMLSCSFVFLLKVTVLRFFSRKRKSWNSSTVLFSLFPFAWSLQFSGFPILLLQRPQEIFNCHIKYFDAANVERNRRNFSCGTRVVPSLKKSSILPARVANHAQHRNCFILPLPHGVGHIIKELHSASLLLRFQIFIALPMNVWELK